MVDVVHALGDPCFIFFVAKCVEGVVYLNKHFVLWIQGFIFVNGHQTVPLYPYTAMVPPVNVPDDGVIVKPVYAVATL